MKKGDIILVRFPFAELIKSKVRPAIIIAYTKDKYRDMIVCAISSVVPPALSANEILLKPDKINNLKAPSIIKVERIVTLKTHNKLSDIGRLSDKQHELLKKKFKEIVDN